MLVLAERHRVEKKRRSVAGWIQVVEEGEIEEMLFFVNRFNCGV